MDDLISKQSVIDMAKDIHVKTDKGNVYRHRCIDPTAIMELQPVEAIPVWWLKEFEKKLCALGAKETANTIKLILTQWRGEHGLGISEQRKDQRNERISAKAMVSVPV